mgnify:CR=1 FL=1
MLLLNPQKRRTDVTPKRHSEGEFEFLDRVENPFFDRVRQLLNQWFEHMPEDMQPELRKRFMSRFSWQFAATFWELYVHETLQRAGWNLSPHPSVAGTDSVPDFLAERDGFSFYIECTVANTNIDPTGSGKRRTVLYDALDRVKSPNFYLSIDLEAIGPRDPPLNRLQRTLEIWLSTLDPDSIVVSPDGTVSEGLPTFRWDRGDGWLLTFQALPKKPEARGEAGRRTLGLPGVVVSWENHRDPLLHALRQKASRYGLLGRPYIIAVLDLDSPSADVEDIADALYQPLPSWLDPRQDNGRRMSRPVDGFWAGLTGPQHLQVSAVLTAGDLRPWTVCKSIPTLWQNPSTDYPLTALLPWPSISGNPLGPSAISTDAPMPLHQLYGLDETWPGSENPWRSQQ